MTKETTQPAQEPLTCQGRKCQACETNGFKHSPECIVDTAKEQGWSNAPPAAQPAQEPVEDVVLYHGDGTRIVRIAAKRPWVDLTEAEIEAIEAIALTKQWAIRMALAAVKERNA